MKRYAYCTDTRLILLHKKTQGVKSRNKGPDCRRPPLSSSSSYRLRVWKGFWYEISCGLDEECNMTVVDEMKCFLVHACSKRC
ncbi:hypothetical protein FHG87_011997 [Trinorchestia longiramus]|nr:hypothetical protein FHG87_011997 [Trinorchestia longiramus]